jgi:uncharacterized membrane protein
MTTFKETHHRSIVKAISWRVIATLTTVMVVLVLTGKLELAAKAGVADVILKLTLYYLHERIWGKIGFGKYVHPLADLPVNKPLSEEDTELIKNKLKDLGYIDED